jgi:hypothetical protein
MADKRAEEKPKPILPIVDVFAMPKAEFIYYD